MNIPEPTRSSFESEIHKISFIFFVITFFALMKLGGLPPTYYYVIASRFFSGYYFIYFLIIIPCLHVFENNEFNNFFKTHKIWPILGTVMVLMTIILYCGTTEWFNEYLYDNLPPEDDLS